MTRVDSTVRGLRLWRTIVSSLAAIAAGLINVASRRYPRSSVVLRVGDFAPDFELPGSDGRSYRLSDYRHRQPVVLAWFPKAFTGGCTRECQSLQTGSEAWRGYDVRVFAASVDSADTNRQFARDLGIDYPILSDADRRVARAYGVLGPGGFPARWTFYVGKDGRILHIDRHVRVFSHGNDVAMTLKELGTPRV